MADNNLTAIGVVGTDGYTPIYQPDARWTTWSIDEIYLGREGQNKYIPKVNDYVVEPTTGDLFIVAALDPVTLIPTLNPININKTINYTLFKSSTIDNYRAYFDSSTMPYTLAIDGLLYIYSSTATVARIYQGTIIDNSKLISQRYDNSGNFLGFDIPLQKVAFNSHDNYAISSVPPCSTKILLQDGESVTVVIYDSLGKVLSKVTCIVEDMTYVAQAYAEQKYITQIAIKSPFIDTLNDNTILYPVNLPMTSFNPIGVVYYNDGSSIEYPIDNDKFRLYGLDDVVSTILGHRVPLVLAYRMDSNESALASVQTDDTFIVRPYDLIVSNPNTSYNVKLFIYPLWIDPINGYTYKAYLMNLDRNILFDVSDKIALATNSQTFHPLAYGVTQRLTFTLDLSKVSSIFNYFIHVQTVDITLRAPANDIYATNLWEVNNNAPANIAPYGTNLIAKLDNRTRTTVDISSGFEDLVSFITNVYRKTNPIYNPLTELQAPDPTHIEVRYNGETHLIHINEFKQPISFDQQITPYTNVELVFIRQIASDYYKLSIAAMTVR